MIHQYHRRSTPESIDDQLVCCWCVLYSSMPQQRSRASAASSEMRGPASPTMNLSPYPPVSAYSWTACPQPLCSVQYHTEDHRRHLIIHIFHCCTTAALPCHISPQQCLPLRCDWRPCWLFVCCFHHQAPRLSLYRQVRLWEPAARRVD